MHKVAAERPSEADYRSLSEFRYVLRRFLEFSEAAAEASGLTSRQHQALLAIRGHGGLAMTVGELAERLRIRPNSAGELADRLTAAGLVVRQTDAQDHRRVHICLTPVAESRLEQLSVAHLDELDRLEPALRRLFELRRGGR